MFRHVLTSALFAGFAAGLLAAALQLVFVQPVLLGAELYETGVLSHFGAPSDAPHMSLSFDAARDLLSILFSALVYVGYGMLLAAAMAMAALRGAEITARTGLLWGIAGFVALQLAPAYGLPPELPGSAAADLGARQVWWWGTVGATALGLWLIAFGRGAAFIGGGAVLILAPQLIGAPHPDAFTGPVPPELAALFASRALGTGLVAWCVLGVLAGYVWQRETLADPQVRP